jgi:hypothetical protein
MRIATWTVNSPKARQERVERPTHCRYDQIEVTPPAELTEIFGGTSG